MYDINREPREVFFSWMMMIEEIDVDLVLESLCLVTELLIICGIVFTICYTVVELCIWHLRYCYA